MNIYYQTEEIKDLNHEELETNIYVKRNEFIDDLIDNLNRVFQSPIVILEIKMNFVKIEHRKRVLLKKEGFGSYEDEITVEKLLSFTDRDLSILEKLILYISVSDRYLSTPYINFYLKSEGGDFHISDIGLEDNIGRIIEPKVDYDFILNLSARYIFAVLRHRGFIKESPNPVKAPENLQILPKEKYRSSISEPDTKITYRLEKPFSTKSEEFNDRISLLLNHEKSEADLSYFKKFIQRYKEITDKKKKDTLATVGSKDKLNGLKKKYRDISQKLDPVGSRKRSRAQTLSWKVDRNSRERKLKRYHDSLKGRKDAEKLKELQNLRKELKN